MDVIKEISALQNISEYYKCERKKVALVPTMGYLHEGHRSLMLKAKAENEIVIVSIFVNPTQFGKNEDYERYPRDLTNDLKICEGAGVDIIFNPEVSEMYGEENHTSVIVTGITDKLEGKYRPGHFNGVSTVVLKLLNASKPGSIYLGQKDAQQNAVIKNMVKDLNVNVNVVICETIREESGLAMSSRNAYLSGDEKSKAAVLNFLLNEGRRLIDREKVFNVNEIKDYISKILKDKAPEVNLQYYEVTDNTGLDTIEDLRTFEKEILISLAAKVGGTRLIDNIIFKKT